MPCSYIILDTPGQIEIFTWSASGAIITDERLRPIYEPQNQQEDSSAPATRAITQNVYALGDCASIENTMYPATAQVASQKAEWLAKRLNKGDIDSQTFKYRNLGIMAYLGNWNAALQPGTGGDISGRMAFLIWRGAYLTKSVSWRNKILIPTYCESRSCTRKCCSTDENRVSELAIWARCIAFLKGSLRACYSETLSNCTSFRKPTARAFFVPPSTTVDRTLCGQEARRIDFRDLPSSMSRLSMHFQLTYFSSFAPPIA